MIYFQFMGLWTFVLYALDLYLVLYLSKKKFVPCPWCILPVCSGDTFLLFIIYLYYLSKKKKLLFHCTASDLILSMLTHLSLLLKFGIILMRIQNLWRCFQFHCMIQVVLLCTMIVSVYPLMAGYWQQPMVQHCSGYL